MIRMQDPNSSCKCGKATKEPGTFVTRSKIYETRSSGPKRNGDRLIEEKGDVRINSLKAVDQVHLNKMEKTIVSVAPVNNKSFNLRNSTINISKASTNKPHDNNMVVTNGNARHSFTDAVDDNINASEELKLDNLECNCVRSNKSCDESSKLCNKNIPQVEDESEKELPEDKQNGVYERRDSSDQSVLRSNHMKNCSRRDQNCSNGAESCVEKNGSEILANGHTNGRESGQKNGNGTVDLDFIKQGDIGVEDSETGLCGGSDRKKRKSKFEEIFDSYAEFGCNSDKRRSRRPPESYSPEPARRIKLEHLFDEKITSCQNNVVSPSPRVVKKKPVRKYKQKGPIFHYLDLYIKNKDINKDNDIKQKQVIEEQSTNQKEVGIVEPSVVEDVSPFPGDPQTLKDNDSSIDICTSEEKPLEVANDQDKPTPLLALVENDQHAPLQTLDKSSIDSIHTLEMQTDSIDSMPSLQMDSDNMQTKTLTSISPDHASDDLLLTMVEKKLNTVKNNKLKKIKRVKPKPLALDAEIQSVLGYRHDKGKREFLVLFHNGTSNWVIQDNNISITPSYQNFFEHCDHELSTINRLAYVISEYSNEVDDEEEHLFGTNDSKVSLDALSILTQESSEKHSPTNSNSSLIPNHKKPTTPVESREELCNRSMQQVASPKLAIDIDDISIDCVQANTCIKTSPFCTGYNETMSNSDLNELCYYVMSSRHIKLYPFETTKEVVFKRDDEFMHIYLKNLRKSQDDLRRIDNQINIRSCEKLIYTLEDCAVDETCEVVVISGIEEYFALKDVFDKLLRKPSSIEGKIYEQDISMLRYLIQTIRNFTKPICAVIKKTATGLPASMLSLFDMVFDERGENFPKKEKKSKRRGRPFSHKKSKEAFEKKEVENKDITRGNDENSGDNFQSYLFPRLMGLTESNESRIMGEGRKLFDCNDILSNTYSTKRMFSVQLRKSLRNMKNNTKIPSKIRGRKQSTKAEEEEKEEKDEVEDIVEDEEGACNAPPQTSPSIKSNINNLEMEIQREKELTKRSMDELQSILLSMEPP